MKHTVDMATTRHPYGESVYVCGGENHRTGTGVEIARQTELIRDPEGRRRARPAPVKFTHSKTGSDDGCNPRLTAAALHTAGSLEEFPLGRPSGITRLSCLAPTPRPWQCAEIWVRSSPTLRRPPECQPLPFIINARSFPFTPSFLADALYHLLRAQHTTTATVATSWFWRT